MASYLSDGNLELDLIKPNPAIAKNWTDVLNSFTRRPAVAEIADHTALKILEVGSLRAQGRCGEGGWNLYYDSMHEFLGVDGTSYSLVHTPFVVGCIV